MIEHIKEALSNTAIDAFEQLAFLFAFANDEGDAVQDSPVIARISFSGLFGGKLEMKMPSDILKELASNMLGVEEEKTTLDQQYDALKETLNVICGNLLPVIAGSQEIFYISAPEIIVTETTGDGNSRIEPVCCVNLDFDEGQCGLALFIDKPYPDNILTRDKGSK